MKNQKGFTLVELMVVMAIIAILSTAGISQYGRFIKSARDTTRITDLKAINVVILDSIQSSGLAPATVEDLKTKMLEVAGKLIYDKLTEGTPCITNADGDVDACEFKYASCDGSTGYVIATRFESSGNVAKYTQDDAGASYEGEDDLYEIGSCVTPDEELETIDETEPAA